MVPNDILVDSFTDFVTFDPVFGGAEIHGATNSGAGLVAVDDESLESKDSFTRQTAFDAGDSVFVWVAEPKN